LAIDISHIKKKQKAQLEKRGKTASSNGSFAFLSRELSFSKKLNDKSKYRFYSEMSLLVEAGIDIRMALELTFQGEKKKANKKILQDVFDRIIKGDTFSMAIKQTDKFSDYEYYSLKIGEESGNIKLIFKDLADFFQGRMEFKRKLISSFSYPVIVLSTAVVAVFFMLNFIVPIFEDAFKRFGGELPQLTQLVLNFSNFTQSYGLLLLIIITSIIGVLYFQRNRIWFRDVSSRILLKIPIIGDIAQKTYLARFSHSMSLLTGVKNPLVSSIALVRKMIRFYPLEEGLKVVESDILHGSLFHEALSKHSIFPSRMISLIKVAEEVNKLDEVFKQINKQYSAETENSTKTISSLLEPFLIIFIGLFVGVILIAMYLPLFEIGSSTM
tara:strand:+ start:3013 stop:4164 length:1152 start_codon:yes stop_codon:yes gene_type:complete